MTTFTVSGVPALRATEVATPSAPATPLMVTVAWKSDS